MAVVIRGTGKAVPQKKLLNQDLDPALETSDEWIRSHTGIGCRHIAEPEETTSLLGAMACRQAIVNSGTGITADAVDLIVCATATPDFQGFPATACLIQSKLGATKAAAFDVSVACSGFIYGLEAAAGMMERRGLRYALVCGAETLSRIVDWTDRSTCVLFGDGAGAVLLENTACDVKEKGLGSVILGSDGTGGGALYINQFRHIEMNGRTVYNFAVRTITETITALMEKESLQIDDVDLIVCHQANSRIIELACRKLRIPLDKMAVNIERYGNTSSASIPIVLDELNREGKLSRGDLLLFCAFGGGLASAASILRW